ncbi:restriction endonuclease subunit S [Klebsiella aerogenes]|jgi:type I restriction enzyme S subunit
MFVNRILPQEIVKHRIEAEYYSPEKLEQLTVLRNLSDEWKSLDELCEFITDGTHQTPNYTALGVRFLSSTNIGESQIDFEKTKFVSETAFVELKRTKCSPIPGDILISKNGKVGTASVYRVGHPEVGLFVSVALLRYKALLDADFICVFLNSNGGQWQFKRAAKTGVITNLHLEEIREVDIPILDAMVQKYIGDKVRQAEQLRAWAKSIQLKVSGLLPSYINEIQRHKAKCYRAKDIIPERLDSLFYHPDYSVLESKMKAKGCKRLGLITKQVKDAWDKKKAETFEYYEIGGLDITTGQVLSATTPTAGAPSRAKTKVQQGDVLVSTVRPNRKNIGFIVDNVAHSEMVATSGFSVLRFSSLTQAAFYHAWLRTDDATAQLMRWNSGSAYPAIDDDVPLNIIIPDFEKTFVDDWGQKLLDAHFAYVYAKMLTEAAKTLVEALIEGQLTERQLIEAQQALEDGDNSLDQAILSKLSAEGYAIEGATPLFSDMDELYNLLKDAAQAEAEE